MPTKIYTLAILLLLSLGTTAQNVLYVSPGAIFKPRNGALVTIKDLNYDNNGTSSIALGDGTVHFTGNSNDTIMGSSLTSFDIMEVDKPGTGRLFLDRTVSISGNVNFIAGQLHLNNNRLVLSPNALLLNEREGSRIVGPNGGTVEISVPLNIPTATNPGNLGAIITSTSNMGFCLIRRGHVQQTNGGGSGSSIERYFDILPQNNTALDATLQFKYLDAELNGFNENVITLWRSVDGITWVDQDFTSRNTTTNYVEKTGIPAFSKWTLSTPGNPLPIKFILFNTQCAGNKVNINWRTAYEQNSSYFQVQRSNDGANWHSIGHITAAGNSSTEKNYSFTDNAPAGSIAFYRVVEYDINSNPHYTTIIRNDCGQQDDHKVWPNPVQEKLFVNINTANNSQATITVYDSKGALVKQQQHSLLTGNNQLTVNMEALAKGSYNIVVMWNNGQSKKTTTVIKQ